MKKALVIDDSAIDRKLIAHILESFGIASVQVEDGEQAYAALLSDPELKLILIDWSMPVLNGIELVRRIRANKKLGQLKLIMVTAAAELDEVKIALAAGVDEYVMKPLDRTILREKLALVGVKIGQPLSNDELPYDKSSYH